MKSPFSVSFTSEPPSGGRRGRQRPSILGPVALSAFGAVWLGGACSVVAHAFSDLWRRLQVGFLHRPVTAQVDQVTPPVLGLDEEEDKADEVPYRYRVNGRSYEGVQSLSPRNEQHKALFAGRRREGCPGPLVRWSHRPGPVQRLLRPVRPDDSPPACG